MESNREPSSAQKIELDKVRAEAEAIIKASDRKNVFDSSVNEGVVKAMIARQKHSPHGISNWLIVFDWNSGSFVSWDVVSRESNAAMAAYTMKEREFPASQGYEVVMVGSSDPNMIRHTHSHYFGIEGYESVLSTLEGSVAGLSKRLNMGIGARQILQCMSRRKYWTDAKSIKRETLKNHYCKAVVGFDDALEWLIKESLVVTRGARGTLYLNIREKARIETSL